MIERINIEEPVTGNRAFRWWKAIIAVIYGLFGFFARVFFAEEYIQDPGFHIKEDTPNIYQGFRLIGYIIWGIFGIYMLAYLGLALYRWKRVLNRNKNFIVLMILFFLTETLCNFFYIIFSHFCWNKKLLWNWWQSFCFCYFYSKFICLFVNLFI